MKKILPLLALILSCVLVSAQTDTNLPPQPVPTVQGGFQTILDAVTSGMTNWDFTTYYLRANGLPKKDGGGIGAFWHPGNSQLLLTGVRIDYINGDFWMPSGSATLQLPITPIKKWQWLTITPFIYAGIGIPVSGAVIGDITLGKPAKDNNGQPTAILGYGAALSLYKGGNWSFNVAADKETWTGFAGKQYRIGPVFNVRF